MVSPDAVRKRWRPSSRTLARLRLGLAIVAASTAIGMAYWSVLAAIYGIENERAVLLHGGQYGAIIGIGLGLFQVFFMASAASLPLRRAPFLPGLLARAAVAALIILAALVFCRLVLDSPVDRAVLDPWTLARDAAFSVAVYVTISFVVMMQRMIGGRVLRNFVMGRYSRPVREDRVFMFLDLADSTGLAQRLGDIGVHALISRMFFDIDDVILRHGGEVHRYIGDEVVVTWPLADCRDDGRCLSCYRGIEMLIAARAKQYCALFGVVPVFRAGLHGGPVVAGECGDSKQEIVFFGDTINTAARLRSACKGLGVRLLVSADLARAIRVPPAVPLQSCGRLRLAGRREETEVFTSQLAKGQAGVPDELRQTIKNDLDEMEIMIQSTLDFLRGDALGEQIKRVDIATILETVCDRLVDSGHDVALRGETHTPLPCRLTNKSGGGLSVTITLPHATSLPGVSNRM